MACDADDDAAVHDMRVRGEVGGTAGLTAASLRTCLRGLGLELPDPPRPKGSYAPAVVDGDRLWISGHTGRTPTAPAATGVVGRELTTEEARASARVAAVNLLAAATAVVAPERLVRVLSLRGYVRAIDDFGDHPRVIDAASEVLAAVFGGAAHARAALGVASLPGGACVELEAVFALRQQRPGRIGT